VASTVPPPIAAALPALDDNPRVYIIGQPHGNDLAFSFQDNELPNHEGPPTGQPPIPGMFWLHYRAPSDGDSSGSPVFNYQLWQIIGLHHMGGKLGVRKLKGKPGSYGASEGIAIQPIIAAIQEERRSGVAS
jgi:hypothetical protein